MMPRLHRSITSGLLIIWILSLTVYGGPLQADSSLDRIDCLPGGVEYGEDACLRKGCVWDPNVSNGIPHCFVPKKGYGYKVASAKLEYGRSFSVELERIAVDKSLYGGDYDRITFEVTYISNEILRFKLRDMENKRFQVPVQEKFELLNDLPEISTLAYKIDFNETIGEQFSFAIRRHYDNTILWDTSIGGLTFADQFLQIATYLPTENIYGFGENVHESFRHNMQYKTWALFSRDEPPSNGNINLYGVHPFYTCLENNGKSHGVLLLNSNAMDYTLLPAPALSYRAIGGILDFFVFVGETPEDVIFHYTSLIGRPVMPPYWALGFQISRYGYNNIGSMMAAVERTKNNNIPLDVQHADIDHMNNEKDFTWDEDNFPDLDKYMEREKEKGMHFIIILDPALVANDSSYEPYFEGLSRKVYITWPEDIPEEDRDYPPNVDTSTGIMFGKVWPPGPVAFPDFFKKETQEWWVEQIVKYYNNGLKFDGIWIDMNEPANFGTNHDIPWYCHDKENPGVCWSLHCPINKYDDPPYKTYAAYAYGKDVRLSDKTVCLAGTQGNNDMYRHYDVHSIYAWGQVIATLEAAHRATGQRSIVITRNTYPSFGQWAGHWLGDNFSRWVDLHRSIIGMLEFNLFGIPYVGADICGFFDVPSPEMCKRWQQLGAFYPFSRNHNGLNNPEQDPGAFGDEVAIPARRALEIRYRLLPYIYTLFYFSSLLGSTVVRPVFHEFPTDKNTFGIDRQFLWGPAVLISPVLEEGQTVVKAYLPNDVWYNYKTGQKETEVGKEIQITDLEDPPIHIRGGFILPAQDPGLNTAESRKNPMSLLVYLKDGQAVGDLFWDDGVSVGKKKS
ncbi:sucrase-isomaltase, intestinal-like [Limulus polyphemus]|uniref:Sucrase-isomaltase, intestinal-like n=1 Tax=Limulus polyphemus TaxID=6850 RepID=A0ABM1SN18_LIMPO|nr:sucrase-isomaltase, intestinal-like [Limulus polyphemus]XP_022245029.1 sucrase-isomaltase, intestinal-like [Limulus polyphemus]